MRLFIAAALAALLSGCATYHGVGDGERAWVSRKPFLIGDETLYYCRVSEKTGPICERADVH